MSAERDLAQAIYAELVADHTAAAVLDLWQHRHVGASDIDDMRKAIAFVAAYAIEAVLARRQREAAPHRAVGRDMSGPGSLPRSTPTSTRWIAVIEGDAGYVLDAFDPRDLNRYLTQTGATAISTHATHAEAHQAVVQRLKEARSKRGET